MAIVETIFTLRQRGWSNRRIARELSIDRGTVARHLQRTDAESNTAIVDAGSSDDLGSSNAAIVDAGLGETADLAAPRMGRPSLCEPFRGIIVAAWERDLSAQRIYQDLVRDHGFSGRYPSVRRFVEQLGRRPGLPMWRMECAPADEVQVDFGRGGPIIEADGRRRSTHVFRVVLSHSRKGYSEAVTRQTTETFLRCIENAFWQFGGVPRRVVLDNLKAAVTSPDWFDPELNPKVREFARHYGTVFWPTKPYMARHKGKIERGIGYVRNNALKGRTFASLDEQNRFLQEWERTVADTRIHGTTRQQVGPYFEAQEKLALAPLPMARFPCFQEGRRMVSRDGHVEVERAYYSVPPEYLGRPVWVRWDSRLVRAFNDRLEQIAVHARREPGRFSTQPLHIVNEKISSVERGAAWLLCRVRRIGFDSFRWAEACLQVRGVEAVRMMQGLIGLVRRHPSEQIDRACAIAHSHGCYRLRTVRRLIGRDEPKQPTFLDEDPLIRPLADYQRFVYDAIQHGVTS
jgi:transposase